MIGVPAGLLDESAAHVASSRCLGENLSAVRCRKPLSVGNKRPSGFFAATAVAPKLA
jgi:hypothetical protein